MRLFQWIQKKRSQEEDGRKNMGIKKSIPKRRVMAISGYLVLCSAIPAFADLANAGENFSAVAIQQGGAVALAIVAFVLIKFLVKKAWVQAAVFFCVGGLVLYFIFNPSALMGVGQSLYNIIIGGGN